MVSRQSIQDPTRSSWLVRVALKLALGEDCHSERQRRIPFAANTLAGAGMLRSEAVTLLFCSKINTENKRLTRLKIA